jgi:hypothetical protein
MRVEVKTPSAVAQKTVVSTVPRKQAANAKKKSPLSLPKSNDEFGCQQHFQNESVDFVLSRLSSMSVN